MHVLYCGGGIYRHKWSAKDLGTRYNFCNYATMLYKIKKLSPQFLQLSDNDV